MKDDRKMLVKNAMNMLANLAVNYDTVSKDASVTGLGELAFLHRVGDTAALILQLVYELQDARFMYSIEKDQNAFYADITGIHDPQWLTTGEREKLRAFCRDLMDEKQKEDDEE